jgi:hypothetical protein
VGSYIEIKNGVLTNVGWLVSPRNGESECKVIISGPVYVCAYRHIGGVDGRLARNHRPRYLNNQSYYTLAVNTVDLGLPTNLHVYVDDRGDVQGFRDLVSFEEAMRSNSPLTLSSREELLQKIGHCFIRAPTETGPRPTRFERLLRDNEVWEDYVQPPRPVPIVGREIVTEEDLARIFKKPEELISSGPGPMGIDITKLMEEVLNSKV